MCSSGNGIGPGAKAFRARWTRTIESFPPEKSNTGRSNWPATSRRVYMASDSSSRRYRSSRMGVRRQVPIAIHCAQPTGRTCSRGRRDSAGKQNNRRLPTPKARIAKLYEEGHFGHGVKNDRATTPSCDPISNPMFTPPIGPWNRTSYRMRVWDLEFAGILDDFIGTAIDQGQNPRLMLPEEFHDVH